MVTYLRFDSDTLDDAKRYRSKRAAIAAFAQCARELARYGQHVEATLHYANTRDKLDEYPNLVLSIGPRGGIRRETT